MKFDKRPVNIGVVSLCAVLSLAAVVLFYNSCGEAEFGDLPSTAEGPEPAQPVQPAQPAQPERPLRTQGSSGDQQSHNNKVDIIFVVDNSSSMRDKQPHLAENLRGFIDLIDNLDYRISVTTTQLLSRPLERPILPLVRMRDGGSYFITHGHPQPEQTLQGAIGGIGVQDTVDTRYHLNMDTYQRLFIRRSARGRIREHSAETIAQQAQYECGIWKAYSLLVGRDSAAGRVLHYWSPTARRIVTYPFLRPSADLIIIVLTDEKAACVPKLITVEGFLQGVSVVNTAIGEPNKKIVWHSMLDADPVNQVGYKDLSTATGGVVGRIDLPYAPQLRNRLRGEGGTSP